MLARLGFRKGRVFKKDRKGDDNKFEATLYLSWPGQARPDIANEGTKYRSIEVSFFSAYPIEIACASTELHASRARVEAKFG
jgi:hypothetical protein